MKKPYFRLYVQDFIIGTMDLTAEEVGAYIRLLCHQWDAGFIEKNDKKLKKITGISSKRLEKTLKKFSVDAENNLKNIRLEAERVKMIEYSEKQSNNGKRGGRPNKLFIEKESQAFSEINQNNTQAFPEKKLSLSLSLSKNTVDDSKTKPWFEMFRRVAGPHINNDELNLEIGKFLNKYPNAHPNKTGALINTWVGNIGKVEYMDVSEEKKMVY